MNRSHLIRYILIVFWWIGALPLFAQNPYAVQLTTKEGLPSNAVFQLYQDTRGFIWIANNEGICRYDGFEFVQYTSENQSSKAGSFIVEDKLGRIWYENFDGHLFYVEKDSLHYFSQSKTFGFVPFCISDHHLFVMTVTGIDIYEISTLHFLQRIPIDLKEIEHAIYAHNSLYFICDHILYQLNSNFELSSNAYFLNKSIKSKQFFCYQNSLFVFSKYNTSQQLYEFDQSLNFKTSQVFKEPDFIQGCSVMGQQIWVYTSNGILIYQLQNSTILFVERIFANKNISNGMTDPQGNYWISTLNEGILFISSLQNKVYSLQGTTPSRLVSSPHGLIMSTQTGTLLRFNRTTRLFESIYQEAEPKPINYLRYDSLQQRLIFTSKGFNFIGLTHSIQTAFPDIALKSIVRIDQKYFGIAVSGFFGLLIDPGFSDDFHSEWDEVFEYHYSESLPAISPLKINIRSKSIDYDASTQTVVVATNEGLFTQQLNQIKELKLNNETFFGEQVFWHNSLIYALDAQGNLFTIDANNQFQLKNTELGIPLKSIKRIKKVGNELLIVTPQTIYSYQLSTNKAEIIDFPLNYYSFLDIEKHDGHIYILTTEGLIEVGNQTATVVKNSYQFIINFLKVNQKKIFTTQPLIFDHDENNISVNFSVIDYGKTNKLPVYYRLNSGSWMLISEDTHTLLFSALSPGSYLLEFKIGNTKIKEAVRFEILSPYWLRWWFVAAAVLLLLLTGFLYYKWRMNRLSTQIELLKEKVRLEQSLSKSILTAVKSQMNPHFFYNALNTIQAFIYTNDNKKANTYLAKFSKLTRTVLEMSERDTITLTEEFNALNLYLELEKMRFSKNFEFTIHKETIRNPEIIEIPPMLIQPYVENAIKHGLLHREGHRQLDIDFKLNDNQVLVVTIDDNGIGRKKSEELNQLKKDKSRSFSTAANKKRLEILNSSIHQAIEIIDKYDKEGNATGTTVILNIQFK
jgi:hypothetical protein